ncbi:hypothetical protein Taro_032244 [Colocasia esculenta]|uniref:Bulb-type lectin domain-containing protein n=1 Tax=Colocasia esculenta TaxID=4460 RepID=A0A843VKV7_COLES|nr:hypothetical protein [Colocasia esculenta]
MQLVANRDRGINNSTSVLSFHSNDSLILSDARGEVYWSTGAVAGVTSPISRVLDSANFVVTSSGGGAPTWQSFDYPTDSLLPAMKLGWDLWVGRNRNITSWRSANDPVPGQYSMVVDVRGDPQMFHNSTDEVYYQFDILNNTVLSSLGLVEHVVWIEGTKSCNQFWFAPKD